MSHQVKKNLGVTLRRKGAEFRVWAPFARKVSIIGTFTPDGPLDMTSEQDGYWSLEVTEAEAGQSYKYLIDTGSGVLEKNDPRARALTTSDNGYSVVVANDFEWTNREFELPDHSKQIIYEMHIGTFNRPDTSTPGTFDSAVEKLDYLKDLGINVIELMPVTSMAFSSGWGYAPNHIYSVENSYGGRHGLMKFVNECHARGIGVILDVVYNHFSSNTDLWQFDGWSENGRGGIYFYNDIRGDTPWGGRPDYGRPEVRQFILDNITMWLSEYALDGLRVDSTIYMRNTAGWNDDPEHDIGDAWRMMADITDVAHKINPRALMVAEDFAVNSSIVKSTSEGGCGFDTQWEIGFPHALRDALGLSYDVWPNLAAIDYELAHGYSKGAFDKVIFSDSHDTAANGSVRLNQAVTPSDPASLFARQKALLANAITLSAPGIPMLLQGEEFMQGGAFNDWQALQWQKTDKYPGIVLAHKHLISLRLNRYGNTAGLSGQSTAVFHQDNNNLVIGYHRWEQGGPTDDVLVIVNFADRKLDDYNLNLPRSGLWHVRFNSSWHGYSKDFKEVTIESITADDSRLATLTLPVYGVLILSQDA